jgi:uncharacterized protein YjbJ (UPF0337 family)
MNKDEFEGQWKQIRGQAQQRWGKLTNDDLEHIGGEWEKFVGLLQAKYGYTRETVEFEFSQGMAEFAFQQRHKQHSYQPPVLDIAEDQWKQMHSQARVWWSRLTDEELDKTAGKAKAVFALLQAEYRLSSDAAEAEFKRRVREYALSQQAHPVPETLFILKN